MNLNKDTSISLRSMPSIWARTTETVISRRLNGRISRRVYRADRLTESSRARLAKALNAQGWSINVEIDEVDMETITYMTWRKPITSYQVYWRFTAAPSWVSLPNMWVARDMPNEAAAIEDAKAHAAQVQARTPAVNMGEFQLIGIKPYVRPSTAYTGRYAAK